MQNNYEELLEERIGRERLDEDIQLLAETLRHFPDGHPKRGDQLELLAEAFRDRFGLLGAENDLQEAIRFGSEIVGLRPAGHPDRGSALDNLGISLMGRYQLLGHRADLDEAVGHFADALQLHLSGDNDDRSRSLNNLANALNDRYDLSGSQDDLDEAVRFHSEALRLRPPGHADRDVSLNNLANALSDRYDRTNTQADLDESIRLHTEALTLQPLGHPDRGSALNNLANALSRRYERSKTRDDVEQMVQLHREGLKLHPPGHHRRSSSLNNLANALSDRFQLLLEEHDIEETVSLLRQALDLCPPGNAYRASSLNNLANALNDRYEALNSLFDLNEMVKFHTEALSLRPAGHPFRGSSAYNLASALIERYKRTGAHDDLDETVALLKDGSLDRLAPLDHSLGCAIRWIGIAARYQHHSIGDAFINGVDFLRRYLTIGPTARLQYDALLRQPLLISLPMDAAAHFLKFGDIEQAVELLDDGRSLIWSDMRRFRASTADSDRSLMGEGLAVEFDKTRIELQEISTVQTIPVIVQKSVGSEEAGDEFFASGIPYGELLSKKRKLLEHYDDLIRRVREKPGLHNFQTRPSFRFLQQAAVEGPVILINCSSKNSHAIIIFADRNPSLVELGKSFYGQASDLHRMYLTALDGAKVAQDASRALHNRLRRIAMQLWSIVVSKILDALKEAGVPERTRIWWCPTSFLTLLPLHAAGNGRKSLIDFFISSYTPSLKALVDTRRASLSTEGQGHTAHPRLLVTAQTVSSKLPSAKTELDVMRGLGPFVEHLDEAGATKDTVLQHLETHNWSHFICHGTICENSFESALILHDGALSLNDIIQAHLPNADFAFIAACHSAEQGRGESVLSDEVLHLAAAMQFSGFRSVVGTMWEMEDSDGPDVARWFYEEMLKGDGDCRQWHTRAAYALSKAMRKLRKKPGVTMDRWANFIHIGA